MRLRNPDYHALPVLPFGDPRARLLIVGLAPGMHGANRTGRPFTGDYAGILLYETLHAFGFGCSDGPFLAANFVVIGKCPKLHAVGFGSRCQCFWRERAIRDHGVAMKIGVE